MSYILKHLAKSINNKLDLIDENKNLLPYPYNSLNGGFSEGLEDVGDGSILTSSTSSTALDERLNYFSLPTGNIYMVSLSITNILEEVVTSTAGFSLKIYVRNEADETFTSYETDSKLGHITLDLSDTTVEHKWVSVWLDIPESFDKGLLIKPQIELQPTNEDGTPSNEPTAWAPYMKTIGSYVDRRFNSVNAKIKILNELLGLPDCSEYSDGSTLVVKDGVWTIDATSSTGLVYELNDDKESYSVTGIGSCEDTDIVIPAKYKGLPVTDISWSAFHGNTDLTSVDIPGGVNIEGGAFQGCTSLTSADIPYDASLGTNAFTGCTSLTTARVIKDMDSGIYEGCTALTKIIFFNNAVSIPYACFKDCTSLKDVNIPASITKISNYDGNNDGAFENCTGLTSITIPDSATTIDIAENTFYNTGYYNKSSNWEYGVLYIGNHLIRANDSYSDTCTIKDGTKTIAHKAFTDSQYDTIEIPNSITHIASDAFSDCTNLRTINCAFAQSVGLEMGAPWGATGATINYNLYDIDT